MFKRLGWLIALFLLAPVTSAFGADKLDTGDTAWMIVSTALVMMMTPAGLALFYGGLSRYKNMLNTFAMTFVSYCLASVIWMLWGYTLSFGPSQGGFIGGLSHVFLGGIGVDSLTGTIPTFVFVLFQMTFAGVRRSHDFLHHFFGLIRIDHNFDLDLGDEVDHVFGAAVDFLMPFLPAVSFDLRNRHPLDADFVQCLLDIIQLERLDDGLYFLHFFFLLVRKFAG